MNSVVISKFLNILEKKQKNLSSVECAFDLLNFNLSKSVTLPFDFAITGIDEVVVVDPVAAAAAAAPRLISLPLKSPLM